MEVEYVLKLPQLLLSMLLLVTLCQQHRIVIAHSRLDRQTNEQTTSNSTFNLKSIYTNRDFLFRF